jgi:hypothetical protein
MCRLAAGSASGRPWVAKSPKKSKPREDLNTPAARIVAEATGAAPKTPDPEVGKDPAAVRLGRKGGQEGGKARASKLTAAERSAVAKKAAQARWSKAAD